MIGSPAVQKTTPVERKPVGCYRPLSPDHICGTTCGTNDDWRDAVDSMLFSWDENIEELSKRSVAVIRTFRRALYCRALY